MPTATETASPAPYAVSRVWEGMERIPTDLALSLLRGPLDGAERKKLDIGTDTIVHYVVDGKLVLQAVTYRHRENHAPRTVFEVPKKKRKKVVDNEE